MKNVTPIQSLVRDYVPGQKISEPGIYRNMPIEVYHGDCCVGPSISSSGIRAIESKSLKHFHREWSGNPNRKEQDPKPHFALGRAVHHLAGGEGKFAQQFVVRPEKWDSWRTKDAKDWRTDQQMAGKDVLEPKDLITIRGIMGELEAHPVVKAGILHGLVEHSIFWTKKVTLPDGRVIEVWCKARPDVLPVDSDMIVDLKTTADAGPVAVRRAITDLGYHIQLGMIHEGLLATTGRRMSHHHLVFVEKEDPWCINNKPMPDVDVEYGRRQFLRGVRKFAQAVADNDWPGYEDDDVEGGLLPFAQQRLAFEAEKGLLPPLEDQPDAAEEEAV